MESQTSFDKTRVRALDRGTLSKKGQKNLLDEMKGLGLNYIDYPTRVGFKLSAAAIEIKRLIDRKITSKLNKLLPKVTDNRFQKAYADVKLYPIATVDEIFEEEDPTAEDKKLLILINFVIAVPPNDSLDSMATMNILCLFQEDPWNADMKKISNKNKMYEDLNTDKINALISSMSYANFSWDEFSGLEWVVECDACSEDDFDQLKELAKGKNLVKDYQSRTDLDLKLKKITRKNAKKEIPVLISKILDALNIKNIDPSKIKNEDTLFALAGCNDTDTISLEKSILAHFNVLAGFDLISVQDAIDAAIEIVDMQSDD